jgi:putative hemolysin
VVSTHGLFAAVARAADLTVADIMIPKAKIFALTLNSSEKEIMDTMMEERFSRVPMFKENIDDIAGILHLRDFLEIQKNPGSLRSMLKPVLRVPMSTPILKLLQAMQRKSIHIAIIKDEYGHTQGMVTLEDILEELVGEIRDEFDSEELSALVQLDDSRYDADADMLVLDFNRRTGWEIESEKGQRLSGLIFNALGRNPGKMDRVKRGDLLLEPSSFSSGRASRIRLTLIKPNEVGLDGAEGEQS